MTSDEIKFQLGEFDVFDLDCLIAAIVQRVQLDGETSASTPFDSDVIPNLSLAAYIQRIHKYFDFSSSVHVVAMIYLDMVKDKGVRINRRNVYRLLGTAYMLATKFMEDDLRESAYYVKVLGFNDLENLEWIMFTHLDHNLFVTGSVFEDYLSKEHLVR